MLYGLVRTVEGPMKAGVAMVSGNYAAFARRATARYGVDFCAPRSLIWSLGRPVSTLFLFGKALKTLSIGTLKVFKAHDNMLYWPIVKTTSISCFSS